MGKTGTYFDALEKAFGAGSVTDGYRTQAEQDSLRRRGVTRAAKSAHTDRGGYDFRASRFKSEAEVRASLAAQGFDVDKVIYETGKGRNQGTGPHWHTEGIRRVGDRPRTAQGVPNNSSQPGTGVANPQAYLDQLESNLAPESRASGGVRSNTSAVFNSDEELNQQNAQVQDKAARTVQAVDVLSQVTEVAQAAQVAAMERRVSQTRGISKTIIEGKDALVSKIKPVIEQRGRVMDQMDRVNQMNPLERGFRGIFDLNYDTDYLSGQLKRTEEVMNARAHDFDYMNKLHDVALTEIEREYGMDTAVPDLMAKQADEDLRVAGLGLQAASNVLGATRDEINSQVQVTMAKSQIREDTLSQLDGPTVMDLANAAKANNGIASHNGVEFSYGELRDRLEKDEHQELTMRSIRVATAAGEMGLAEKHAENLARSLTRGQVDTALANGGVYNGVQLPQDTLVQMQATHANSGKMKAEELANTLPAAVIQTQAIDGLRQATSLVRRTQSLYGNEVASQLGLPAATAEVKVLADLIRQGAAPEIIATQVAKVTQANATIQKAVEGRVLRAAGGDKESASYIMAYLTGTPIDQTTATSAITKYALAGSMPFGMQASKETQQVFKRAQQVVAKARRENPKIKQKDLEQLVREDLGQNAGPMIAAARFNELWADMPRVAKALNHPFSKIDPRDWNEIRVKAERDAAATVSREVGTGVNNIIQMATLNKPLSGEEADIALYEKFKKVRGQYNGAESQSIVTGVDALASIQPGTRNSTILKDLLQSPGVMRGADSYRQARGSSNMGDYLVNPFENAGVERMFGRQAKTVIAAQDVTTQSMRLVAQNPHVSMIFKPVERTKIILGSIPGVGQQGAKSLTPAIQAIVNTYEDQGPEGRGNQGVGYQQFVHQDEYIYNALSSAKFENPAMEAYRKQAVKGWTASATQAKGFFEQILYNATTFLERD